MRRVFTAKLIRGYHYEVNPFCIPCIRVICAYDTAFVPYQKYGKKYLSVMKMELNLN